MAENKVFSYPFADIYPLYLQKAQKKGRTKEEVDTVICWLTGYDEPGLARQLDSGADLKAFFENAPRINPASSLIKGGCLRYPCGGNPGSAHAEDPLYG